MQLDLQTKFVSAAAYANSTLKTRRTIAYLRTVILYLQIDPHSIRTYHSNKVSSTFVLLLQISTIINYLSAINVLHRHFGHHVTFQDLFSIRQKLPITPEILLRIHPQFTAASDSGLWAAILIGSCTFR